MHQTIKLLFEIVEIQAAIVEAMMPHVGMPDANADEIYDALDGIRVRLTEAVHQPPDQIR